MENQYLLGIDIGTSSTKVALLSVEGSLIAIERQEHSILSPREGWAELSIDGLWNEFLILLKKISKNHKVDLKSIKAIGISCLCPGLMPFDKHGKALLNPIIFMDKRSSKETALIRDKISEEELSKISSNKLMPGACSLTSMLWIKENMEEVYRNTKYFGHINTFFVQKLTGKFGIDYTNASYTGLFETVQRQEWSEEICKRVDIDMEKLPPLIPSDSIAGNLISEEVIEIGLLKGIPVAMGGADTACSALAVGIIEHNQVFESVGTTNVITVCSEKPVFDVRFMNRCHVIKDRWLYHGAMSSTGASLKWFRDEFCSDLIISEKETGVSAYKKMDELVCQSMPGANGLIFLPYLSGERTPVWDPNARGVFFGLTLQTKKADIVRSILEGCGYGLKQIIEIAEFMTGEKINEFVAIGGGAKSEVWGQIKADITGKTIRVLDLNDAAVIGAMLLAGLAAGIYKNPIEAQSYISKNMYITLYPQKQSQNIYNSRFETYKSLYPRLKELFS
ncbi:FGGY-family carbohydrate kinase [Petroclostridium sp. X23]|uniref:xylulokinase n=1 Tax=Petroclostridium sp. X23 TaxID=3045146 RepID=UPI0024ADF4E8|nr:FGGY-family carbohydrate kinase [Petroclostridium sp. X23]WHH57322.1 FGGY-family carbohydrate kinase [Petroclostridium sp. X23]